jgi:heptosyltransferase-2
MEFMKIVVRAPNWIGDSILALPALNNLKKNFPDAQIWISAREWVKDLFTLGNLIEGTVPLLKQGGMKALRESSREFKNLRFDLGILFTNSFASALLFYLADIPERWGYKKDGRGFLLTKGIPVQRKESRPHQAHYYLDLLYRSGLKRYSEDLEFSLDQKEKDRAGVAQIVGHQSRQPGHHHQSRGVLWKRQKMAAQQIRRARHPIAKENPGSGFDHRLFG